MTKRANWKPSKFLLEGGRLRPAPATPGSSYLVAALVADFYARTVPRWAHGRLGDLGCGAAPLYGLYEPHVASTVWIDWPNSLHGNTSLDAACDLNVGVPVRDAAFDTIIVSDVLEHLRRPEIAWAELLRTLAPSGAILGNAPFLYWVHEAPYDFHRYTEHALRAAVEAAGGRIESLVAIGGSADVFADFVGKHLGAVPFVGQALARFLARVTLAFGRTRPGARLRAATCAKFPLGYTWVVCKG
ncbi:MAG TPA: methyltransferase domain-containing protein [Acidimicrobiia bacterium]